MTNHVYYCLSNYTLARGHSLAFMHVLLCRQENEKLREEDEKHELSELWQLHKSQETELNDMRLKLSRFMTKGAPILLPSSRQVGGNGKQRLHKGRPSVSVKKSTTTSAGTLSAGELLPHQPIVPRPSPKAKTDKEEKEKDDKEETTGSLNVVYVSRPSIATASSSIESPTSSIDITLPSNPAISITKED